MMEKLRKLIQKYEKYYEGLAYLFFGGLGTLLNIVLYWLFVTKIGIPNAIGNVIDTILCILFAYWTNRTFVFMSKTTGRAAWKEFVQFVSCRMVTLVLDEVIMILGVDIIGRAYFPDPLQASGVNARWAIVVKVFANVLVIIFNYVFSKLIIFKKKPQQQTDEPKQPKGE